MILNPDSWPESTGWHRGQTKDSDRRGNVRNGRLLVSFALIAVALAALVLDPGSQLAPCVVTYVASHWLPVPQHRQGD